MAEKKTKRRRRIGNQVRDRWWIAVGLILILSGVAFVRIRLLDMPLERDEGEYAYAGQLMLQGIPPYKLAYNMKLPGTYAAYALIMASLGQDIRGIHLGLLLVNGVTIVLTYFLGVKLFGRICGLTAAATFALLSLSDSVRGLAGHATHFVTLFSVAGAVLLLRAIEPNQALFKFLSGLTFGLAFVMKQPAIFLGLFAGLFLIWKGFQRRSEWKNLARDVSVFSLGATLPFGLVCLVLTAAGVFHQFWFWTFSYAWEYVATQSLAGAWMELQGRWSIVAAAPGLWILAVIGVPVGLYFRRTRQSALFTCGFFAASIATTVPSFYFRAHYFIPLLPAIGLFCGQAIQIIRDQLITCKRSFWMTILVGTALIALAQGVFTHRVLFFSLSPNGACRKIYGTNPFPEALELANFIREHSSPDNRIAVIGSEPEIYFYSKRHSATGYIYTYALMEPQRYALTMQREMTDEIERANPEFVVLVYSRWSWLRRKESESFIFDWVANYIHDFERVAVAEIPGSNDQDTMEVFQRHKAGEELK